MIPSFFLSRLRTPLSILFFCFLSACAANDYGDGIFSYSKDRCLGAYNQCANGCKDAPYGGAQAACFDRCLARQSQCYTMGDDGAGSTLAQDSLIDRAKTLEEKAAAYEEWRARKAREAEAAGPDCAPQSAPHCAEQKADEERAD